MREALATAWAVLVSAFNSLSGVFHNPHNFKCTAIAEVGKHREPHFLSMFLYPTMFSGGYVSRTTFEIVPPCNRKQVRSIPASCSCLHAEALEGRRTMRTRSCGPSRHRPCTLYQPSRIRTSCPTWARPLSVWGHTPCRKLKGEDGGRGGGLAKRTSRCERIDSGRPMLTLE
jgi:hypothetical protein